MEVLPSTISATKRRVSFSVDDPASITSDTVSVANLSIKEALPQDSVKTNDLGFNKAHSATSCAPAVDYHIMSTFASLLPSLQLAFFSKPKEEKDDAETPVPRSNSPKEPSAAPVSKVVDGAPATSQRPANLRQPSSTSSDQSAGHATRQEPQVDGFIWKDGQRVRYVADASARRRKGGKIRNKEKQRPDAETFVIVRPPPSSSKRTLNLQIQLVTNAKQKTAGRESRSASGSSLASVGDTTTATLQKLAATESITSSYITTRATVTPREVDFKSSTLRKVSQSRDASPTRTVSGEDEKLPLDSRKRKPVHKRTSSMSLDEGLQGKKQSLLGPSNTQRPLSMSFTSPETKLGDNHAKDTRKAARDSDSSCFENANGRNLRIDSEASPSRGKSISRASSVRSVSSNHSFASTTPSAASGISLSGLSTSSSGSRTGRSAKGRIIPLYNLAVHNVMTTTISDAGTDSKIAKFHKRSVDIVGLGTLEAAEVWLKSRDQINTRSSKSQSIYASEKIAEAPLVGGQRQSTDTVESAQVISSSPQSQEGGVDAIVREAEVRSPPPPFDRTKKLFGKLFKKKDGSTNSSVPPSSPSKQGFQAIAEHLTAPLSPQGTRNPFAQSGHTTTLPAIQYGQPTLGMSPIITNIPSTVSHQRPQVYTWTIKRWTPSELSMINDLTSKLAPLISADTAAATAVRGEVVFEWRKAVSKSAAVSRTTIRTSIQQNSPSITDEKRNLSGARALQLPPDSSRPGSLAGSRRSSYFNADAHLQPSTASASRSSSPGVLRKKSSAGESAISTLSSKVSFDDRAMIRESSEAPGKATIKKCAADPVPTSASFGIPSTHADVEDSDPEDSETPWICRVYVPGSRTVNADGEIKARGKTVGTLFPAPHHPRIVATIKIPLELGQIATGIGALISPIASFHAPTEFSMPLPSASKSARNSLSSPAVTGSGQIQQQSMDYSLKQEEIILTEENIKDVVSVTAMWLVSREFGALGKKKKSIG
ncbi:hypothetical protein NliqN6_0646 [Naganishia liquefaciens]|uniref:Uncharacterized protein n=1 Tax=Naganishia liquefaciens TaxID=104408 RepID=A0A8H3TQ25_9TREE|nr:hypothetical protein NliqN6_0646 [Naganishia liquefaciens]